MAVVQKTTSQVIVDISEAIINDKPLTKWCMNEFGKLPTMYEGWDPANLPEVDLDNVPPQHEYPLIVIASITQDRGQGQKYITFLLYVGFSVVNTGIVVTENPNKMTKKSFSGFLQVEAFREQVENAIFRAKVLPDSVMDAGYDQESLHPIHESYTSMMLQGLRSSSKPLPG